MRLKTFVSVSIILALVIGRINIALAYDPLTDPVAISGEGMLSLTPGPLLDDFRHAAGVNVWGSVTGTFSKEDPPLSDAFCAASYTGDPSIVFGGTGYSLQLDYNVSGTETYAGYFSDMAGVDISSYKYLSFWVRGTNSSSGEYFKIELKNNSTTKYWDSLEGTHYYRNSAVGYITDYLDGGVTTEWKKVSIPLHNFVNLDSWISMKELVIIFENSQSNDNGSPTQGTIYIDDIKFEDASVDVVRIDHFGDEIGTCALGGNIGDFPGAGGTASHSFSSVAGTYHNSPNAMLSEYNVTSGYAGHFIIFGGGNADGSLSAVEKPEKMGWIKIPHDFSDYSQVTFYAKAKSATENPKVIRVEFLDNSSHTSSFVIVTGITTNWSLHQIPLSSVPELDETTIKQITFVYEGWRIGTAGSKIGTLYIDEVQFEK
ncbi:MAG: hypothetical protein KAU58_00825 [Candidatus Omnitrophica bacterium]|nr:hypothetical protein [Candidatus Omnitrophota bacterium]